jgi:S-adenosylmethionine:tRNA ribosyltransferase-isomerase
VFALSDYTFELPPELIAQQPAPERDASRLLHLHADGKISDHAFAAIVELLPPGAVLIANDTYVIRARVLGHKVPQQIAARRELASDAGTLAGPRPPDKPTGGRVELLFLEPADSVNAPAGTEAWRCLARARRPLKPGQVVTVDGTDTHLELLSEREGEEGSVVVAVPGDVLALLDRVGHVPLPRYIQRDDAPADRERYQTMFARVPGAVAAPTAGLHMTKAIATQLEARGVTLATVTLHVGYGTFEPVRSDDIREHHMHRERYVISAETAALVASGRPIVALGTTAMRALESAATGPKAIKTGPGTTTLFVYPGSGHRFQIVDHLITNFHLPESTLLMLVCAFAGTERVLAAYRHAVAQRYRFFSYGDAMLLHRTEAGIA